jgi:hypothetical protein
MSEATAEAYAKSLAESIRTRTEKGIPFGITSFDTGWTDDDEHVADYLNNEETEFEEASAMDYLSDVLDIQYIVSSGREYCAARVLVAFGGPNAWINTQTRNLEVAWWGPTVYEKLPATFVDALDDAIEELWEMGA